MIDVTTIERELLLDCDLDEARLLATTVGGLGAWFADQIDLDMEPGSTGTVIDDDREYLVSVDEVGDHGVAFTLAPADRPDDISLVRILATPGAEGGSTISITETWPAPVTAVASATAGPWTKL